MRFKTLQLHVKQTADPTTNARAVQIYQTTTLRVSLGSEGIKAEIEQSFATLD